MSTTDKILKEMEDMKKGGEGSGKRGHKTPDKPFDRNDLKEMIEIGEREKWSPKGGRWIKRK